jgi:starch phosphorylase
MSYLALNLSSYVNGVSQKHKDVTKKMFPDYEINAITNGVHSYTWTCESFRKIFDKYLPEWAIEPELLARIDRIPDEEIWQAHMSAKKKLIDHINEIATVNMDYNVLTIGFARRATPYKRATMILSDFERLKKIKETCDRLGVEIIPTGFNVGYGGALMSHDRNLAAGLPVKDALFVARGGEARFEADSVSDIGSVWESGSV